MAGILPGIVMTVLLMLTVFIFARRKGWGSDTPFELRRLMGASLEIVMVLCFPAAVYLLILAGLSVNVAVLIGLVMLIALDWLFRLPRRHGADDPGAVDRRHDHGLVHTDRGRRGGGDLVSVPRPGALSHHDLPGAGESLVRRSRRRPRCCSSSRRHRSSPGC